MKIGFTGFLGESVSAITDLARALEAHGFESFWTGEHIIVPVKIADPVRNGIPLPDYYKHLPDIFVILTAMGAVTTKLKLGTNICIVPQRNPLHLAKEVATLDQVSHGRFLLGIGNGWIEEEAPIFGYNFKEKVKKTNEHIEAMKVIWAQDEASFSGDYVSFPAVYSYPKPFQNPHPPILIGAGDANIDNTQILKRVARIADGWLPLNLSPDQMKVQLGQLREYCEENGRSFDDMDIGVIVASTALGVERSATGIKKSAMADEILGKYEEAGVNRVVVLPWNLNDEREIGIASVEAVATGLGLSGA